MRSLRALLVRIAGLPLLDGLARDFTHAARSLRRSPGFTSVAALTLALGIGGCAVMYAFARQIILLDYPYPDLDSLVVIEEIDPREPLPGGAAPGRALSELATRSEYFVAVGGYNTDGFVVAGDEGLRILEGALVTPNVFEILGVTPLLGRIFSEDEAGSSDVVILGERAWRRNFGGRVEVVGSAIELSRKMYTVIGVMPESFWRGRDVWVPLGKTFEQAGHLRTWARLVDGAAAKKAQAELDVLSDRLALQGPAQEGERKLALRGPFELSGGELGTLIAAVVAPVALVFLIACVNIAHLQFGRDLQRGREMAVRLALGAGGSRLVRQLLAESLLLAVLGGVFGAIFATWGVNGIAAYLPAEAMAPVDSVHLDRNALLFLFALAALSTVVIGLAPALRVAGINLTSALRQGGRGATSRGSFRSLLVTSELALSTVLLVGTGMMAVLVRHMTCTDLGFDEKNLWTVRLSLRGPLANEEARRAWTSSTLERIGAVPGVVSASVATEIPLNGGARRRIEADDRALSDETLAQAEYRAISPAYFETMHVPVRLGRSFGQDDRAGAAPVAIVNETLARRFFAGNALGKRLRIFSGDDPLGDKAGSQSDLRVIVGVVADVRQTVDAQPAPPIAYVPFRQAPRAPLSLVVRTMAAPQALGRTILEELGAPSPEVYVQSVFSFEERIFESARSQRFLPLSMAVFAGFGLILAGVGLYGTTARAITQRTQELGVRQALGALPGDVLRLVMRQSGRGALAGMALGAAGSWIAARLFLKALEPRERSAFGVDLLSRSDLTFASLCCAVLLLLVIACATYIPARRAMRVEPTTALRCD